jgi:hypothetical protein
MIAAGLRLKRGRLGPRLPLLSVRFVASQATR